MAPFKARALYDFSGEAGTAEMTIHAGEELTVTRTNVGEGWWEGINSKGESGLFPEAYVEALSEPVASSAPPMVPPPVLQRDWDDNTQKNANQNDDWDDDDWDDDTYSEIGQGNSRKESFYSNEPNQNHQPPSASRDNVSESNFQMDNKGTITKKSLNRFSSYVKSGLESYMLGTLKDNSSKKIHVYNETENSLGHWERLKSGYTVQVTSPKKSSKMGGLKSFIAYQLTPSFTNIEVSRRYKHFDWLHDRLTEKFNVIAIPPLPDKQISGRYEDQFIEHRRAQLQEFVNYMCRHPVLSQCDVWLHFLRCTDDKQWKLGKRNAEKDQLIGANFCLCIEAPEKDLLPLAVDKKIDESYNYINKMDQAIKLLMQTSSDQQKKCVNMYKREFYRLGESFAQLGANYDEDGVKLPSEQATEIQNIGACYVHIGDLYESHSKNDWQTLADKLYIYKGITGCIPDILNLQKSADQKKKEHEKNIAQPQTLQEVRKRSDILTYAVFAELNHFQNEKNSELRTAMRHFIEEQISFYKNIVGKLEDTLSKFK